ncbi:GGDEF domain-containing protein [Phreatobacter stygius]|uniref:diguanylate cyclase n=1 Tax=Phreatobacter stygius TaxID=1940610 RepID=A0A4D7B9U8_9HYPH|nr:GGDEF domain-containing protein [Phreatobacter stygius]QCI67625.1 GGDEF domain-containing protein [Phreatobacter stygius]
MTRKPGDLLVKSIACLRRKPGRSTDPGLGQSGLGQSGLGQSDHSLHRKLWIGTGIVTVCTIVLAMSLLVRSYDDFVTARRNLHDVSDYGQLLETANLLSAERGPTNGVLGEEASVDSASRQRLAQFRRASDAALAQLTGHARTPAASDHLHVPPAILDRVLQQLTRARAEVDRLGAMPLQDRRLAEIQHAIESMFAVVDLLQPAIGWKVQRLIERDASLAGPVLIGQMLGDLREYGGRIASQIMAPIAARQPLALANLIDFSRTRGRLLELWQLVGRQTNSAADPRLADVRHTAEQQFFGQGLTMLDDLVQEGRRSGDYSMTPAELTARFVPTLRPLEQLRRGFLDQTIEQVSADRDRALRTLAATAGLTTAILAILAGLIVSAQRFVFRPLLLARNMVIALAEDRDVTPSADPSRAREMNRLFDAIEVLRGKLRERAVLTGQLKLLAETDGLTGLLNRGALERIGETDAAYQGLGGDICLILMDIDHFKQVNDRHGHLVGDQVLTDVAGLVRSVLRPGDIVARFGGEEIAILVAGDDIDAAAGLAKRMRLALQQHDIVVASGGRLAVTASFGVARGRRGKQAWHHLIEAADAALYRAKSDGRNRVRCAPRSLAVVPQAIDAPLPEQPRPREIRR